MGSILFKIAGLYKEIRLANILTIRHYVWLKYQDFEGSKDTAAGLEVELGLGKGSASLTLNKEWKGTKGRTSREVKPL